MIQWSSYTFSQAEGPLTFLKPMAQWSSYTLSQADGTLVIFLGAMVQLHILPQADGHRTFVKPMAQWSSYTLRPTAQWSYLLKPMAHWSSYILSQASGTIVHTSSGRWSYICEADGTMVLIHTFSGRWHNYPRTLRTSLYVENQCLEFVILIHTFSHCTHFLRPMVQ